MTTETIYKCDICKKTYIKEDDCKKCETICKDKKMLGIEFIALIVRWNELEKQAPMPKENKTNKSYNSHSDTCCLETNHYPKFSFEDKCCCDKYEKREGNKC